MRDCAVREFMVMAPLPIDILHVLYLHSTYGRIHPNNRTNQSEATKPACPPIYPYIKGRNSISYDQLG